MIIHLQKGECEDWECVTVGRVEGWDKVSTGDDWV